MPFETKDGETETEPFRLRCPGCEEEVDVATDTVGQLVRCPYCNTDFFASDEQSRLPVVDDTARDSVEEDREAAFDKLRIENYTALRMGAIRARSWWMIGMCMAILMLIDLVGKAVIQVWVLRRWGVWPTFDCLLAALAWMLARHASRRARQFKLEIDRSALPEPTTPPDFSTLSDGKDRWQHLENVR